MAEAQSLVSVEEYLSTVYKPDCDYVDGEVLERNMAEIDHGLTQAAVASHFFVRRREWNISVMTETRVQVKPTRFRVPDIAVVLGAVSGKILTEPPFLCIEILSPEDRWGRVEERIDDFLEMGVRFIWILDPQTRHAFIATPTEGMKKIRDGVLRTQNPAFEIPLSEFFS